MAEFPRDWEVIPFCECFTIRKNNTCARTFMSDTTGSVRNVHYGDVLIKYGSVLSCDKESIPFLTPEGEKIAAQDYLQDGDVVIADTAEDETAGKVVEIQNVGDSKIVAGLHTVCCRPVEGRFASGWLGYWMNSPAYHKQLIPLMTGIKVLSVSKASFSKTYILAPSYEEQKQIAAAFIAVDKLIDNLARRIEKKRLMKQGVMQDLLTGKKRLPGFKGEWNACRLFNVAEFSSTTIPSSRVDLNWYIGTENMLPNCGGVERNTAAVPYVNVREFVAGDILVSNIRPYLKKIWLADKNGGCSTDVLVVRGNRTLITPTFLYCIMSSDRFFNYVMDNAIGTKMPRGDKRVIMLYEIFIPTLREQESIASILGNMDAEIAKLEAKRDKYINIKRGVMNDLLTGKVRI